MRTLDDFYDFVCQSDLYHETTEVTSFEQTAMVSLVSIRISEHKITAKFENEIIQWYTINDNLASEEEILRFFNLKVFW